MINRGFSPPNPQTQNVFGRYEVKKDVWGRGYAPSYDNSCVELIHLFYTVIEVPLSCIALVTVVTRWLWLSENQRNGSVW